MKLRKKGIMILIFAMMVAAWSTSVPTVSAKVTKKSVTVYKGASKVLKIKTKKKIKWKSSKKKIATVSKKGKVKGKKVGKCTITAVYGKNKTKFKVTVKNKKKQKASGNPSSSGSSSRSDNVSSEQNNSKIAQTTISYTKRTAVLPSEKELLDKLGRTVVNGNMISLSSEYACMMTPAIGKYDFSKSVSAAYVNDNMEISTSAGSNINMIVSFALAQESSVSMKTLAESQKETIEKTNYSSAFKSIKAQIDCGENYIESCSVEMYKDGSTCYECSFLCGKQFIMLSTTNSIRYKAFREIISNCLK